MAERAKTGLRFSIGGFSAIPDAYLRVIAKAGGLDPTTGMTLTAIAPLDLVPAMGGPTSVQGTNVTLR